MNRLTFAATWRRAAAAFGLVLAGGCSGLLPPATPPPSFYSLDGMNVVGASGATAGVPGKAPTLVVNPTRAAPGFDSRHIVYVRATHQLEHFAHSEWVDTPARMLAPLIVSAVEGSGSFQAVGPTAGGAAADLRLDTELMRLQQDFSGGPSRVRFTMRAYVLDGATRRVLSWREFDATVASASDDPYGGVVAANRAVRDVMERLASFCADTARSWTPQATGQPAHR
jgi:cholesterol transport system auxiliary component